jgi:hypothetical protein
LGINPKLQTKKQTFGEKSGISREKSGFAMEREKKTLDIRDRNTERKTRTGRDRETETQSDMETETD